MDNYLQCGNYICSMLKSIIENKPSQPPQFECDWEMLYSMCVRHKLTNMACHAVRGLDVPQSVRESFDRDFNKYVVHDAKQKSFAKKLFKAFEEQGIDFMPVKGIIIRELYPSSSMRVSGDIDILVGKDCFEKARQLMLDFGFEFNDFDGVEGHNDQEFHKKNLSIELHTSLTPFDSLQYEYFSKAFERARLKEGFAHYYEMTDEDFYIYILYHMYKHFIKGGVGIKYYLDLFIINSKMSFDEEYISTELEKIGLNKFNRVSKELSEVFFGDRQPDQSLTELARFVYVSGAHGESEFYKTAIFMGAGTEHTDTSKNKRKYFKEAWFIGRKAMSEKYPILNKLPFLLPFCYIHKGIYTLLFRRKSLKQQIDSVKNMNEDSTAYLRHINDIAGVK